jgi:hypothetical protein
VLQSGAHDESHKEIVLHAQMREIGERKLRGGSIISSPERERNEEMDV